MGPQFNELLSYRFYRLRNRDQARHGRDTGKIKDHIKLLELAMRDLAFDGADPVFILDFLNWFTKKCDTLKISEVHALIAIQYLLK